MILDPFQRLGKAGLGFFERLGRGHLFLMYTLAGIPGLLLRPRLVFAQLFSVGVLTLLIILVSGVFVGMVLGLQGYNTLVDFGAEESLGVVVALSLVRELGPVVAALLFAGRAGSALTAEIGLMKATEQLSGMEMMAVDPMKRVVAPRFLAGFLSRLFCGGWPARRRRRRLLVADAGQGGSARGYFQRRHQERCVRFRGRVDCRLRGV